MAHARILACVTVGAGENDRVRGTNNLHAFNCDQRAHIRALAARVFHRGRHFEIADTAMISEGHPIPFRPVR